MGSLLWPLPKRRQLIWKNTQKKGKHLKTVMVMSHGRTANSFSLVFVVNMSFFVILRQISRTFNKRMSYCRCSGSRWSYCCFSVEFSSWTIWLSSGGELNIWQSSMHVVYGLTVSWFPEWMRWTAVHLLPKRPDFITTISDVYQVQLPIVGQVLEMWFLSKQTFYYPFLEFNLYKCNELLQNL